MFSNILSCTIFHYTNYGDTIHTINVVVRCKQIIVYINYLCPHSLMGERKRKRLVCDMVQQEEWAWEEQQQLRVNIMFDHTRFNNKFNKSPYIFWVTIVYSLYAPNTVQVLLRNMQRDT